ncbi:peptidoglycan editing factor PgeF [Hydrogenimonas sp.]|uniref:peptidoglycan editing factor PgeF n=1 Tax=Hydrogenimonas sp. TaxID=2231112 RepID=UPI0026325007|nr:peptidoglycan editing factor PgeF [Hydrogenimonas sp.]
MTIRTLFTDRHGGESLPPYDTFNLAYHTGDLPEHVDRNRILLQRRIGSEHIAWMDQVHGDRIRIVESVEETTPPSCDALVTDRPGIALAVMVADCIPILLHDPVRGVIAAVHAGRNGTFLKVASKTAEAMGERFGSAMEDIRVTMGPSIHACCYEVGEEIGAIVRKNFGDAYMNDRSLNLQELNREMLLQSGITRRHIEISDICTCCNPNYFSYRRERTTGRSVGVVWIEK